MLDLVFNADLSLPINAPAFATSNALILTGCKIVHQGEVPYSEIDTMNFYRLNANDYGCGYMEIELSFNGDASIFYSRFEARCVTFYTDNGLKHTLPGWTQWHKFSTKSYTKISKEGKMVIGLRYYFPSEEARDKIFNCTSFCIDGFFAIKHPYNVYAFSCVTKKVEQSWQLDRGNTSKIYRFTNIRNLIP